MEIYELKYPIKVVDGIDIPSVEIKRPKGKHLKKLPMVALEGSDIPLEILYPFLGKWLNLSLNILDEMDGEDLFHILEVLEPFLPSSPETGKK